MMRAYYELAPVDRQLMPKKIVRIIMLRIRTAVHRPPKLQETHTMKTQQQFVVLSLMLASGAAAAQQTLPSVEVSAESANSLTVPCDGSDPPSLQDVEMLLGSNDPSLGPLLRTKFTAAVSEACIAMKPKIAISRTASGESLTWKPIE